MRLDELKGRPGSRSNRIRVGRGIGSGKGKTCGRGVKGQKSRSGVAIKGFEGGQMPIYRRLPKRGFVPHNRNEYAVINLSDLQSAIDDGKLDTSSAITSEILLTTKLVSKSKDGVRLLGKGQLTSKCIIEVQGASKSAVSAVENAGGSCSIK